MIIHQAFFGDSNGSHNVLATTFQNKNLIGKLKSITDNPAGISVDYAYLSGYLIEDFYIFCKTMTDTTAKRGGMVFSHCLMIPKTKLSELNNLVVVFEHFAKEPIKDFTSLTSIDIDTTILFTTQKPSIYDSAVHHLIGNKKTVVYLGYTDFEDCIKTFWYYFPVALRECFSFTISGKPSEIIDENFTLIHTPEKYQSKWHGFSIIKGNEKIENKSLAYIFLSEFNNSERMTFQQFISENDILITQPYQLSEIAKCFNLVNLRTEKADLPTSRNLIILLSKLLPNVNQGKKLKTTAFDEFIELLKKADCSAIQTIRNVSFKSFENGQTQIEATVNQWSNSYILPSTKLGILEIAKLLITVFNTEDSNWWNKIFLERISFLCKTLDKQAATFIWQIWAAKGELIDKFKTLIDTTSEDILLNSIPKTENKEWFKKVSSLALFKEWYALYATSIANYETIENAIYLQIKSDKSRNLLNNLNLIAIGQEKAFVLASSQINNDSLHKVAGKLCATKTEILSELNVTNIYWQSIWYEAYLESNDIQKGIKDLKAVFYHLLDLKLKNASINENLLINVTNNAGNIFDYSNRKSIWNKLSDDTKGIVLDKTAFHVFENYENVEWGDLEDDLIQFIKKPAFINANILSSLSYNIKYRMIFLEKLSLLNENTVISILKVKKWQIDNLDKDYLIKQIKNREWDDLLEILYDNRKSSTNLSHIVYECREMLGSFQRFFLNKPKSYNLRELLDLVDTDVSKVFLLFDSDDREYNRLRDEFVAGPEGIKLEDLCKRLKVHLHKLAKNRSV